MEKMNTFCLLTMFSNEGEPDQPNYPTWFNRSNSVSQSHALIWNTCKLWEHSTLIWVLRLRSDCYQMQRYIFIWKEVMRRGNETCFCPSRWWRFERWQETLGDLANMNEWHRVDDHTYAQTGKRTKDGEVERDREIARKWVKALPHEAPSRHSNRREREKEGE